MIFPDEFKIVDDGKYGHNILYWICKPHCIIQCRTDKNDKIFILYDKNYKIDNVIIRDSSGIKQGNVNLYRKISNFDPRFIVYNYKLSDLSEFGLDDGYIIMSDVDYKEFVVFSDSDNYISYLFYKKNGVWKIIENQTWKYKISKI